MMKEYKVSGSIEFDGSWNGSFIVKAQSEEDALMMLPSYLFDFVEIDNSNLKATALTMEDIMLRRGEPLLPLAVLHD